MQHVMKLQDSHEQLLERRLSRDNMHRAWTQVKANKGAPGVGKMTVEQMPEYLRIAMQTEFHEIHIHNVG